MVSSIWRRTTISWGASFPTTSTRRARSAKRSPTCRRWGRKRRGMFRIKVCGVTSPEDAALAVDAGADAVGINFYTESARYVDPRAAAPIVEAVGKRATVVGVFVNERPERIAGICGDLGIRVVQLSGREPADSAARVPFPVIKAVHGEGGVSLEAFRDYPCGAFLLDAAVPRRD